MGLLPLSQPTEFNVHFVSINIMNTRVGNVSFEGKTSTLSLLTETAYRRILITCQNTFYSWTVRLLLKRKAGLSNDPVTSGNWPYQFVNSQGRMQNFVYWCQQNVKETIITVTHHLTILTNKKLIIFVN